MINISRKDYESILLQILNTRDMREITGLMIKSYRFGLVISDLSKGKQSANYHILEDFASIKKINEQFIIDQAKTAISVIQPIREDEDYYKILGCNTESTTDELRLNWINLMKKFHPDKVGETGLEKSKKINEAYNVLSDIERRRDYDEKYFPAARINVEDPAKNQFRNRKFLYLVVLVILIMGIGYIHNMRQIARINSNSESNINDENIKLEDYSIVGNPEVEVSELFVDKNNDKKNMIARSSNMLQDDEDKPDIETAMIDNLDKTESEELPYPDQILSDRAHDSIFGTDNIKHRVVDSYDADVVDTDRPEELARSDKNQSEIVLSSRDTNHVQAPVANSATDSLLSGRPDIKKEPLKPGSRVVSANNQEYEMNETEYDKVAYDNELWKDQNNKTAFTNHKKKNQLEIPDNRSPDSFESSRQNARKTLIPAQRVDINLDPDYVSLSNNGNLPDKSSVYLVISDYITAYKNRDIRKLEGLFSSNARENGKSIEEVIKTYKDNFERINVLAYDIKFDNVNFVKDRADVYGDFIITFRTNEDKINQQSRGNIYWNLSWDQDNWIIDEINYEVSRTSKEHAIESAF